MRNRILPALLVCLALACGGCEEKEAREYAGRLANVLRTYKIEVDKKIDAERGAYQKLGAIYSYARQYDVVQGLRTDRYRRANSLVDSLLQGRKLAPSEIQQLISDNAKLDFDAIRSVYEAEIDDSASYLTGLETMELQVQSIDALIEALEDLAKPKSDLRQLREFVDFAAGVKNRLDALACEDLVRRINCLKHEKDQTTTSDARKKEIAAA